MSVIIPVLDAGDQLATAIASVWDPGLVEVIVVDNASSDQAVDHAIDRFPGLRVIRNDSNAGFAGASNQGSAIALGRYLLFLNSDATLEPAGLKRLVEIADSDQMTGLWQPVITSPRGDVENAGEFFTWSGFFVRLREVQRTIGDSYPAFGATAACLLVRAEVFAALEGFRDSYFAYIEDLDLCWRARLAGWEVQIVPGVAATHLKSMTTRRILERHEMQFLTFRNRLRMIVANSGSITAARVVPCYVIVCIALAIVFATARRGKSCLAIVSALAWPLFHFGEIKTERRASRLVRRQSDGVILRRELTRSVWSPELRRMLREHLRGWARARR